MFAIPIAIAAPVVYGLAWGFGTSLVVPTLGLLGLAIILGTLTIWLARRVLEPAERLEQARIVLEDAYDRARAEALRDTLTGLGNHRAFQEEMERQWATAVRHHQPLVLAIVDLDDFKRINDAHGHAIGDRILRQAATTIATYLRRSDRAFRVGGDEFAIIMPGTDAEQAHTIIRRLLAACLDGGTEGREGVAVSFSAGVSEIPGRARDRDSLPFARGKLVWISAATMGEAQALQGVQSSPLDGAVGNLRVADLQREHEVLESCQAGQKTLLLVDESYVAADPAKAPPPPPMQATPLDPDLTSIRPELPVNQAQEGGLACPARAGDLNELPRRHREADVVEHRGASKKLGNAGEPDHWLRHHSAVGHWPMGGRHTIGDARSAGGNR